ncbi:hypothetical protein HFP15_35335 [Amycolatopsis sp. K13G38]|uniref:PE domain-containing protein n=1 Tax=Amycolatopsis acididurans TaxID=2724524 RepID=A0ABX1JEM3_9PSEU|nr:hypothetical protein [Amycolatopsis acididurans]NKQ58146.1 hypothetical protein [Amycolatopsis acididurans]
MGFFDGINFAVSDGVAAVAQGAKAGAAAGGGLVSWTDVGTDVAKGATGTTASPLSSGGIMMDRDEMTAFLTQVKQTRELCIQQVQGNRTGDSLTPPASDQASTMFTNAAQTSRDGRNQYLQQQLAMYNELVDKLSKALGLTTESDVLAGGAVQQAAGGGKYS